MKSVLPDAGRIKITTTSFPDSGFRAYAKEYLDTDGDGYLSLEERESITDLSFSYQTFESLAGIEYFTNLETLIMYCNYSLSSLDVSRNVNLKYRKPCGSILSPSQRLPELFRA